MTRYQYPAEPPSRTERRSSKKWRNDMDDPDPWFALYVDSMAPINPAVKHAWLTDVDSKSRQFWLPLLRPFARLGIVLNQVIASVVPFEWRWSAALHRLIVWGLRYFVSPQANWLIVRHFHAGAEIQRFILDNLPDVQIPALNPMRFRTLGDLKDHAFLKHDLNLFNFIIEINLVLNQRNQSIEPPAQLDFSAITDGDFDIAPMPASWHNVIDLQTAIELYTPVYQFFLTDNDFWRAVNSLQLDETIAMYVARILDDPLPVLMVNNKHPLVPEISLSAAYRLSLHGLGTEMLHHYLVQRKRAAAAQ